MYSFNKNYSKHVLSLYFWIFFKSSEVATALENRSHKVRYSNAVESGSIIFSCTGIVYLLTAWFKFHIKYMRISSNNLVVY